MPPPEPLPHPLQKVFRSPPWVQSPDPASTSHPPSKTSADSSPRDPTQIVPLRNPWLSSAPPYPAPFGPTTATPPQSTPTPFSNSQDLTLQKYKTPRHPVADGSRSIPSRPTPAPPVTAEKDGSSSLPPKSRSTSSTHAAADPAYQTRTFPAPCSPAVPVWPRPSLSSSDSSPVSPGSAPNHTPDPIFPKPFWLFPTPLSPQSLPLPPGSVAPSESVAASTPSNQNEKFPRPRQSFPQSDGPRLDSAIGSHSTIPPPPSPVDPPSSGSPP